MKTINMIFVHIPRTAGTSISNALGIPGPHKPILYYQQKESKLFYSEPSFAVIRHPLDQIESWYWWDEYKRYPTFREWAEAGFPVYWKTRFKCEDAPDDYPSVIRQEEWIEIDDECKITYLIRFERLEEEFDTFCKEVLSIKTPAIRHYNKGARRRNHKGTVWTPDLIELVRPIVGTFAEKYGYELWTEEMQ